MSELTGKVIPVAIEDEVKTSYLNYAMSVIVSRALPDVRDGLKPVHRRILYGMNEMGIKADKPPKKCARIVGDVLGKFHPHGDQSVYDALVRLAQDFSMRYLMVNGQGNFGSVDGDPPAAMRYTEARMHRLAEEMLADINKETVDFGPNYDDSMEEPSVLPAALPYLLVNGASGIAVGMATNIPPHNLREVAEGIAHYIDNRDCSIDDLMQFIKGPDFPTAGLIYGRKGIQEAYRTGRGSIVCRAKFQIETKDSGKDVIIINEIPYQVNKANLIIRIAELMREDKIDGISDLRDESDRDGMRIVIELKRGASPKIILNQLFQHTQLQLNFNVNALALVKGKPQVLNIKDMIVHYVDHRKEVVTRRTIYDLRKAEEKAHILEGLKIALENIDEVIRIIKESDSVNTARTRLMDRFSFSEVQAQAILDMRLQKLTSLETQKIIEELQQIQALIAELKALLASEEKILQLVKKELLLMADQYGDARKTEIVLDEVESINIEDLIQKEEMVVILTNRGYIKRVPYSAYRLQGRGGKGASTSTLKDDDYIKNLFIASTHDVIMFITSEGRAYWLKVHEIPEGSRIAKGTHIRSLLNITANEMITATVSIKKFTDDTYIFIATSKGTVKKVPTSDFVHAKIRGVVAINLRSDDKVIAAILTSGKSDIFIVSRSGKGLRFAEEEVRPMGRVAQGVGGLKLQAGDEIAGVIETNELGQALLLSENGYGKRLNMVDINPHGRNTQGRWIFDCSEKTGEVIGVVSVQDGDDIMAVTSQGSSIKVPVDSVPVYNPNTQGVRIVNISKPDYVVGVDKPSKDEDEDKLDDSTPDEQTISETEGASAET
jgi:DNA gyrase subunit A